MNIPEIMKRMKKLSYKWCSNKVVELDDIEKCLTDYLNNYGSDIDG